MADDIQIGDKRTHASGNVSIASNGEHTAVSANGLLGALLMSATKQASLQVGTGVLSMEDAAPGMTNLTFQAGPAGSIVLGLGPAEIGPRIEIKPGSIELAVGPPVVGSSIKLTPAGINLQIAETSYEMTPLGITESVAEVTTRSATAAGHELKSAESSYQLNPIGENVSVPTSSQQAMTTNEVKGGAETSVEAAAMGAVKAAMVMIN